MEPWDRLEQRMMTLENKASEMNASLAAIGESLKYLAKVENRVDKLQRDVDEAHKVIRANKMVIDMVKWSVMLIVPATLSVFVALAIDVLT